MFADASHHFGHFDHSISESFCSSSSITSYPSTASDISAPCTSANTTPACSPNRNASRSSSVNLGDCPSNMELSYEPLSNLCSISQTAEEMAANFHGSSANFNGAPRMMFGLDYGFGDYFSPTSESFASTHGLPMMGMSPFTPNSCSSGMAEEFVDPSQIPFMEEAFEDLQSTFRPPRMSFTEQCTPTVDFDANFVYVNSPQSIRTSSPCGEQNHVSETTCRTRSIRQSLHTPLAPSATLNRVQSRQGPEREITEVRNRFKRHREARHYGLPCNIRVEKVTTKACLWQGCGRSFKRQEHLKRHEKTHGKTESYACEICGKDFNRTDNLKAHTKLHAKEENEKTKSSRTKFDQRASTILSTMAKRSKRCQSESSFDEEERPSLGKRQRTCG